MPEWPGTPVDDKQQWPGKPVAAAQTEQQDAGAPQFDVGAGVIIPSAGRFARDVAQPFIHPVETAKSLKDLGLGILEKTGLKESAGHEKYADAVGQFFVDRYGSIEKAKHTLETDPVGMAADVSMFLTGGGSAAARLPGIAGKIGEVTRTAGRVIDPLVGAGKVAKGVGYAGSEVLGALGSHTGGKPLQIAAKAGAEGGEGARAFQENLRGAVPAEAALESARQGLAQMVEQRGAAYRTEMAKLGLADKPLNFDKIDDALTKATEVKTYKGVDISPTTTEIRQKMTEAVQMWRRLGPEFHTAEGFDKLKQMLGDIRDGTERGSPERLAANKVYGAVRQAIIDEAPQYKKVMEAYEEASNRIKEMEKSLSLNPNASIDTSLRKLQSVLRDNVSTSYSHRRELAEFLVKAGAPHLMERLAGQALQPWLPRGLGRLGAQVGMEMGTMFGGLTKMTGLLALGSPRLLGESAYYLGKASPYGVPAGRASFQTGRIGQQLDAKKMLQEDAKAALIDKDQKFTTDERRMVRLVARGTASVDERLQVKKLLEGQSEPLRITVAPQGYGGPQ